MAIFVSRTNMSTFKDARTFLLESYLDGVIDDTMKPSPRTRNFHMNLFFNCCCLFVVAIMTSKFRNTETIHWTPLVPLPCCSSWFQFHLLFFLFSICLSVLSREYFSDLELPFCQLWNKQLQFSSSFQRPLPISFLSQLYSFLFHWRDQQLWFSGRAFGFEENSTALASRKN